MSLSGNDVLALIERTLTDTRTEITGVDTRLARSTGELERLRQAEIGCLSVLARMRLREIEGAEVSASLDATGESVRALLARARGRASRQRSGDRSAPRIGARSSRASARRSTTSSTRPSRRSTRRAPRRRRRSRPTSTIARRCAAAEASDRVADLAEEKAKAAHVDRAEKGKPYEADPLFSYLWTRGFGTPAYVGGGMSRMLDRWVARVANFEPLRRDYWLLTELPARFDEHAKRMRVKSDDDLAAVHALERAAAEAAGVPQREEALEKAAEVLAAVDEKVDEHEAAIDALIEKRAAFAAGDDELSRRCNEIVRDALRGETMRSLRERANSTPTPDDDAAVDQLTERARRSAARRGRGHALPRAARDEPRARREARGNPQALQGEPLRRRVVGVRERRADRDAADAAPRGRARRRRHLGRV